MNKNYHKLLASTCMVVCLLGTPKAMAQAVIFPQQQQAGIALVEVNGEEYVLKTICSVLRLSVRPMANCCSTAVRP